MFAYDALIIRLLILSTCGLFIFWLLLLTLILASRIRIYYRRTRIEPPREATTLGRLMSTILRVGGLMILVGLLILSSIVLLRYLSNSRIVNISDGSTNATLANRSVSEGLHQSSNPALKGALSNYWGYILAGLLILIILILTLKRIEGLAGE